MRFPQPVPSEDSTAGVFARQLALLIGTAYQPVDNTRVAARLLALGGGVRDARATNIAALNEAFPDTTVQMLPDWEQRLRLANRQDLSNTARQQRLLAKRRAARSAAPNSMLVAIRSIEPAVYIVENAVSLGSFATTPGMPFGTGPFGTGPFGGVGGYTFTASAASEAMFVFAVVIPIATFNNPTLYQQIRAIVEQMKPTYTLGNIPTRVGFRCDDPLSLVDRDVLRI